MDLDELVLQTLQIKLGLTDDELASVRSKLKAVEKPGGERIYFMGRNAFLALSRQPDGIAGWRCHWYGAMPDCNSH